MTVSRDVVIVDYGVGNLHSLLRALQFCGARAVLSEEADTIAGAAAIVLPGVGAFESGMRGLKQRGIVETVKEMASRNIPMLGICLGAQLLLTDGYEFGKFEGLDIIAGKVVHFPTLSAAEKIPHVGWNAILPFTEGGWMGTMFEKIPPSSQMYFVHSYVIEPVCQDHILAVTTYGEYQFCSAVRRGNIYGCQFHPEKSGAAGLTIIREFINLVQRHHYV